MTLETQIETLTKFFRKRPMKVHWLQLPDEIKSSLEIIFHSHSNLENVLFSDLGLERLKQLKFEREQIEEIVKTVKAEKEKSDDNQNISYVNIRHQVTDLLNLISLRKLTGVLEIPRSTLADWRNQEKKINNHKYVEIDSVIEKETEVKNETKKTSSIQNSNASNSNINKSDELKNLQEMINRHKGKTRRKYSQSEKDLILKLLDRFGSKLVHTHTKVSYDTISRLLRQRERGYVVPATKVRYLPVIETMRKYPGMGPMQIRDYM